jgi:hypothetical protein
MAGRTEVRFNFYNTTTTTLGVGVMPFNTISFNVGGGDFISNKYTIPLDGTYLVGASYNKAGASQQGNCRLYLERSGLTTGPISLSRDFSQTFLRTTINQNIIYNFIEGDIIYMYSFFGNPKMNNIAPTGDDIYNSFWGIRLDY